MTSPPLVTVIAVCYNHSAYVTECLDSIQAQTINNYELLIFDDCSSDNSVAVINDWVRRNKITCQFVAHEKNIGLCRTLNEALGIARGRYVCIVATDDVWEPEKLELQTEVLEAAGQNTAVAFSDAYTISADGTLRPGAINDYYRGLWGEIPRGNVFEKLFVGCFVPAPTAMIRRATFDVIGFYDEDLAYEDWDMWLRIARQYHFAYLDRKLARYRVLETSMHAALLEKKTIAKHLTNLLIRAKHVRDPNITRNTRELIQRGIRTDAEIIYELKHSQAVPHLRTALSLAPSLRIFALLVFALMNKPYTAFEKAEAHYKRYSSYAIWRVAKITGCKRPSA